MQIIQTRSKSVYKIIITLLIAAAGSARSNVSFLVHCTPDRDDLVRTLPGNYDLCCVNEARHFDPNFLHGDYNRSSLLNCLSLKGQYHERSSKFCVSYAIIIKVHSLIKKNNPLNDKRHKLTL